MTLEGVNFCLLWALVLTVSWVVVFRQLLRTVQHVRNTHVGSDQSKGGSYDEESKKLTTSIGLKHFLISKFSFDIDFQVYAWFHFLGLIHQSSKEY